jgi:hypothetical protein
VLGRVVLVDMPAELTYELNLAIHRDGEQSADADLYIATYNFLFPVLTKILRKTIILHLLMSFGRLISKHDITHKNLAMVYDNPRL